MDIQPRKKSSNDVRIIAERIVSHASVSNKYSDCCTICLILISNLCCCLSLNMRYCKATTLLVDFTFEISMVYILLCQTTELMCLPTGRRQIFGGCDSSWDLPQLDRKPGHQQDLWRFLVRFTHSWPSIETA